MVNKFSEAHVSLLEQSICLRARSVAEKVPSAFVQKTPRGTFSQISAYLCRAAQILPHGFHLPRGIGLPQGKSSAARHS